jgi:hypothetical protein
METQWPFDQQPRVAALTTRQVLEDGLPILRVVHYLEDEDWAFTCGTTNANEDARLISMEEALKIDPTLTEVADLPLGWGASRTHIGGSWSKFESPSA